MQLDVVNDLAKAKRRWTEKKGSKRPGDPPAPRSLRTNAHPNGPTREAQLRLQISISGIKKRTQLAPCTCLSYSWQSFPFCSVNERDSVFPKPAIEVLRGSARHGRAWNLPCSRPLLPTCLWNSAAEAVWVDLKADLQGGTGFKRVQFWTPMHRKRVWKGVRKWTRLKSNVVPLEGPVLALLKRLLWVEADLV